MVNYNDLDHTLAEALSSLRLYSKIDNLDGKKKKKNPQQKRRSIATGNFGYPPGRLCNSNAQGRIWNYDLCLLVPALMNLVQHCIAKGVWEIL